MTGATATAIGVGAAGSLIGGGLAAGLNAAIGTSSAKAPTVNIPAAPPSANPATMADPSVAQAAQAMRSKAAAAGAAGAAGATPQGLQAGATNPQLGNLSLLGGSK